MISLCITNFNRYALLIESFIQVVDDDRISEIVISDDCSDQAIYKMIEDKVKQWPKVKLYRNTFNVDCYINKQIAISRSSNEWVILFDSDNIITTDFINALYSRNSVYPFSRYEILTPSFAKPHFDFHRYIGSTITKGIVASCMGESTFQTMLNAANYFVHRDEYLKVWDGSVNPVTSDSIFMAYNWLRAGNSIYVVPGLQYYHRVDNHNGEERSHYAANVRKTPRGFHDDIVNKLKAMR